MKIRSTRSLPAKIAGGVSSSFPLAASPIQYIFGIFVYSFSSVKNLPLESNLSPTVLMSNPSVTGYLPVAKKTVSNSSVLMSELF